MCFCGGVAKRRMSCTAKNPGRWFFNCAKKNFNTQCGYFQWCDELYGDGDGDMIETDDKEGDGEEDEYETDYEHEDEEMVSSEEKSELSFEVSTASVQPDQLKELNLFPEYPDLAILVQEYKPDIGLDGSILSLAPAGLPPV